MMIDPATAEAAELAGRIGQLLRRRDPAVIGGALVDVVSTWLAGHAVNGDLQCEASDALRLESLDLFVDTVKQMIPVNVAMIVERMADGKT